MKRIAIIGVGLIGGSLALAFKKKYKQEVWIQGYDGQAAQLKLAETLGVIDQGCATLEEGVYDADFVFLCTPVKALEGILTAVMNEKSLKAGAIVSDVGSTKREIMELSADLAHKRAVFIGGHPMAASHKSGVEAANERLFENAYYVLTPAEDTEQEKVNLLAELLQATLAKVVIMTAEEHDQVVAAISHFPHLIASALVAHVERYNGENPWYFKLAAGGFKDITRIASSNPRMWRDITLSNLPKLRQQLIDWQQQMERVLALLDRGDPDEIEAFFAQSKQIRDRLPERKRGAIPAFYDLYVDIPDHPGIIGQITTLLGQEKISITNLEILESREDILGVLRLTFRHEDDLQRAKQKIEEANYIVYQRE
jgi:prephenate dehydrogenase